MPITPLNEMKTINIYTDGACSGNPGPGGWGAVIIYPNGEITRLSGGESHTTNNRMELFAAIAALEFLNKEEPINIYTDSQYVKNGATSWIIKWKKNGWLTSGKQPVKNVDLWKRLDSLPKVNWIWVRGHTGNQYNEEADLLARKEIISLG